MKWPEYPNVVVQSEDNATLNTDRELFREDTGKYGGSYYENSLHVTDKGLIGMNVGGHVIVLPIARWHEMAREYVYTNEATEYGQAHE